ncbi:MFS transporter [Paramicrobacterium chengjingii]|uniref:MFS transporter n=1 Tax=Paramicrobacterium chengjingii TaxID=2769067 RepID=A0ABX6YGX4_9MICO|nr:MFS transporter [Microbacterium chengjingii]QPZ37998.1 MFS transporter [Microbacterium chengjingii]
MNSTATTTTNTEAARTARTAVAASTIGSILEYYDFFVYGALSALVLGQLFFPAHDAGVSALLSLASFAVGFIARPLGGILLGHFGDRIGRKPLLLFTFLLTGTVTVVIGLLPTYAQIGIAAPLLLVALRILQGIGIGGEWGGAALLAVEHAPAHKKGLYGSLVQAGAPIGVILSSGSVAILTAVLSNEELLAWGWRVPFLASALLLLVGLFLRFKVAESPEFDQVKHERTESKLPVWQAIRRYPKQILTAILIHTSDTTLGLIQGVFILGYASGALGMDPTIVLVANIFSSITNLITTPLAGALGDRIGQKRVVSMGLIGLALWAFPMFLLIGTESVLGLFIAMGIGGVLVGWLFAGQATLFAAFFPAEVRYSGMSLGFQIGTVIGGGFGPVIAQALTGAAGGDTWMVSLYVLIVASAAFIATQTVKTRLEPHSQTTVQRQEHS